MKIIILGAGQVGTSVANNLASEANDITVVDKNPELLGALQERLNLRVVQGNGAHPDVLLRAGAEDADMMLAVTNTLIENAIFAVWPRRITMPCSAGAKPDRETETS